MKSKFKWPLMQNNITPSDRKELARFILSEKGRVLTQAKEVEVFEEEWSKWLGVKYSVFVNSGASANLLTMRIVRILFGEGEVIVPPLTWVSDIASVLQAGLKPVFVDINLETLGIDIEKAIKAITPRTKAVFITHVLGLNCLSEKFLSVLKEKKIVLIEDCCEAHGATFGKAKLGTIGTASNFSFYYAHHMTTIEGGMISTNHYSIYNMARLLRSHGLLRESKDEKFKKEIREAYPDLTSDFLFVFPGYNVRSTEINARLGRLQLLRLDKNNKKRTKNFKIFLRHLDPKKYFTDFCIEGSSSYAFIILFQKHFAAFENAEKVERLLKSSGIEYRLGLSGGGNQLRQPYLKELSFGNPWSFQEVDHVHSYSWYVGNSPDLKKEKILKLCNILNSI